tara:strand:+ start:2511 stop:2687 length:177 start_codon:yes stop_codon:yes gene_type:complete
VPSENAAVVFGTAGTEFAVTLAAVAMPPDPDDTDSCACSSLTWLVRRGEVRGEFRGEQ